jgi:hypothetical protein
MLAAAVKVAHGGGFEGWRVPAQGSQSEAWEGRKVSPLDGRREGGYGRGPQGGVVECDDVSGAAVVGRVGGGVGGGNGAVDMDAVGHCPKSIRVAVEEDWLAGGASDRPTGLVEANGAPRVTEGAGA